MTVTKIAEEKLTQHTVETLDWWVAVGNGRTETGSEDLAGLVSEIARVSCESVTYEAVNIMSAVGVFTSGYGNGEWTEAGLFTEGEYIMLLSDCNTDDGWTSNNTLSVDASNYMFGSGCLQATGDNLLRFRNASLSPSGWLNEIGLSPSDIFQCWVWIDDPAEMTSDLRIDLSSSSSWDTDQHTFRWQSGDLVSGWNFLSRAIEDQDEQTGSPDLSYAIRIHLLCDSGDPQFTVRLDMPRIWRPGVGTMWCRTELEEGQEELKQQGEVKNIKWYLNFDQGG